MISLEQIRLLEGKISRAIELIRVLKDENATLRRGLDSAQKRMKELESLVDGFKTDQKEIESVIVRALRHLDDLEDGAAPPDTAIAQGATTAQNAAPASNATLASSQTARKAAAPEPSEKRAVPAATPARPAPSPHPSAAPEAAESRPVAPAGMDRQPTAKDELDIF